MLKKATIVCFGFLLMAGINSCGQGASTSLERTSEQTDKNSLEVASDIGKPSLEHVHSASYVKPGAAISFTHDYDGSTNPGVREAFTLMVTPSYTSGNMNLELSTSEGLDLRASPNQTFDMSGQAISVPIEIFAEVPGQYRINMVASVGGDTLMPSMRAQTISISVGSAAVSAEKPEVALSDTADTPVIELKAEETIR